jgi:hypothetical protein
MGTLAESADLMLTRPLALAELTVHTSCVDQGVCIVGPDGLEPSTSPLSGKNKQSGGQFAAGLVGSSADRASARALCHGRPVPRPDEGAPADSSARTLLAHGCAKHLLR